MAQSIWMFKDWDVIATLVSMAILFGFEMLGVFGGHKYITITDIIREFVPKWSRAMILGWLVYHFLIE